MIAQRKYQIQNMLAFVGGIVVVVLFSIYGNYYIDPVREMVSDQVLYRLHYEGELAVDYFEYGYALLCVFFSSLGIKYAAFKFILSTLCAFLIYKRISKSNINFLFLLLLYILSTYSADLEQTRAFYAGAIIIYATKYFPLEHNNKDRLKYSLLIIMASFVHVSSLFYLIALVYKENMMKKYWKIVVTAVTVISIIIFAFPELLQVVGKVIYNITGNERVALWFSFKTGFGFVLCGGFYCVIYFLVNCIRIEVKRYETRNCENIKLLNDVYYLLNILVFILPLFCMSTEFMRLLREMYILIFAGVLAGIEELKPRKRRLRIGKKSLWYHTFLLGYVFLYAITFKHYIYVIGFFSK